MSDFVVDMNSDLGEGFGAWEMGDDEAMIPLVSSANIACGYHAGDPSAMRRAVDICAGRGVAVGAHVSYPDLLGFGRRNMACTPREVYGYCLYQIGALNAFCRARGVALQHVKPHGALYNQAARDAKLAEAVARAVRDSGDGVILMGLACSEFEPAAHAAGVRFASEVFADRAYMKDGSLMPRSMEGAVIHDAESAARRAARMVIQRTAIAADGTEIDLDPDTICLHGDSKGAVDMARAVREALISAGVKIKPLKDVP